MEARCIDWSASVQDCTIPAECIQAVKLYPQYLNTSLVDNYCAWSAKGKGGDVEKLCLQAIMEGEKYAQAQSQAGSQCASNDDCASGTCDQGMCVLAYPYGTWSEDTLQGQKAANALLSKLAPGMPPLKETGQLDDETCDTWGAICSASYNDNLKSDPFAMKPDYIVDKTTWYAVPCFASGCAKAGAAKGISAAAIGIALAGILGAAVIYYGRSRRA